MLNTNSMMLVAVAILDDNVTAVIFVDIAVTDTDTTNANSRM